MIASTLRRVFQLTEGEGTKVFAFAVLGGLIQAGLAVGMSVADSLFLTKIGAAKLPLIFIATPLLMLIYVPVYSALLQRIGNDRTMRVSLFFLAIGGALLAAAFEYVQDPKLMEIAYYTTKLFTVFWYIALYTLYWNFVDAYFDILDGKRLFSLLAAGCALGAALGGGLVSALSSTISTEHLFCAWPVLALLALPAFGICRRHWAKLENEVEDTPQEAGLIAQGRQLVAHFRGSRFAMLLAGTLFLTMNVTLVCEYQYMNVLSRHRSQEELTKLFGELFLAVSLLNLFINGFMFQRLVAWFGVRNLTLVQPISYFIVFVMFLIEDSSIAGFAGFIAYQGLLTSIDFNNSNLLMNALPVEGKKSLRTCIEGFCEPVAHAVTGVFLLFLVKLLNPEQLSTIGLGLSVVTLLSVFFLRSAYVGAMVSNLKKGWLDFSRPAEDVLAKMGGADEQLLKQRFSTDLQSATHGREFFLSLTLLARVDPAWTLRNMLPFLATINPTEIEQVERVVTDLLNASGPEVMREFLGWLELHENELCPELIERFAEFKLIHTGSDGGVRYRSWLKNGSLAEKTAGASALQSAADLKSMIEPIELAKRLVDGDRTQKQAAIRLIDQFGSPHLIQPLVRFLSDSDPALQREALKTILELATADSRGLIKPMLDCLEHFAESERLLVLEIIQKIGDTEVAMLLLQNAQSFGPKERRQLETIISNLGLQAIPVVVTALRSQDLHRNARSIAARCLAKLSFAQLDSIAESLIDTEIQQANDCTIRSEVLDAAGRDSSGVRVLKRLYSDRRRGTLNFVLELLSLSGRVASFELLSAKLRSIHQKERANAIETIQQACNRDTFRKLLPLLDPRVKVRRSEKEALPTVQEVLERSLRESSGVEGAAAAQALFDISGEVAMSLLHGSLRLEPTSPRGALILQVISGNAAGGESSQHHFAERTLVERLDLLCLSGFFHQFSVEELHSLDSSGETRTLGAGERIGDAEDNLYLVERGSVKHHEQILERGEIFGIAAIHGAAAEIAIQTDAVCYRYSQETLVSLAAGSPGVASSLFAARSGVVYET